MWRHSSHGQYHTILITDGHYFSHMQYDMTLSTDMRTFSHWHYHMILVTVVHSCSTPIAHHSLGEHFAKWSRKPKKIKRVDMGPTEGSCFIGKTQKNQKNQRSERRLVRVRGVWLPFPLRSLVFLVFLGFLDGFARCLRGVVWFL